MGLGQFGLGCQCCGPANDCPDDSNFESFPFTGPPPPDEFIWAGSPSVQSDWLGSNYGYCYFLNNRVRMRAPYGQSQVPGTFPPVFQTHNEMSYMRKRDLFTQADPNPTLPFYKQKRQGFSISSRFHPIQNPHRGPGQTFYAGNYHGLFLSVRHNYNRGTPISLTRPAGLGGSSQGFGWFIFFGVRFKSSSPGYSWDIVAGDAETQAVIQNVTNLAKDVEITFTPESDSFYRVRFFVDGQQVYQTTDETANLPVRFWDRCSFAAGVEFISLGANPTLQQGWDSAAFTWAEFEGLDYSEV